MPRKTVAKTDEAPCSGGTMTKLQKGQLIVKLESIDDKLQQLVDMLNTLKKSTGRYNQASPLRK